MIEKDKIKDFLIQVGPFRLLLVGLCGVFLVLTGIPSQKADKDLTEQVKTTEETLTSENDRYASRMETKLKEALQNVKGVGKTKVMITLSASRESVVNKDNPYEESEEQQEGNDKKTSKSVSKQEETVLVEEDGDKIPYVIKEYEPEIEGVVAIIEGGDDPLIVSQVTEAIQALFHVEAHKIKVLKMEDGS